MSEWIDWAKRLQALSQAGLTFTKDEFDRERYLELQQIVKEIFERQSDLSQDEVTKLVNSEAGYPTPKMDVRGVVFRDDQLLLVKERSDSKWTLPGGFCEVGLSPSENIVKEIEEEAGFDTIPLRMLALFDMHHHGHPPLSQHYYKVFIECEIIGGEAQISSETSEVAFFSRDALPELSEFRNTLEQIHMCFDSHWQEDWVTLFD